MKLVRRGLLTTSVGLIGLAITYATKPGNCQPIENYGPYNRTYEYAFVYGGRSRARAIEAARLYREGYFKKIIPLGGSYEFAVIRQTLMDNGVPSENIIIPEITSDDTLTNLLSGYELVKKLNSGDSIAHVSDKVHLDRIKMLNDSLAGDLNRSNDGYFLVKGGFGAPIWKLPRPRDSEFAAWFSCIRDRFRIK